MEIFIRPFVLTLLGVTAAAAAQADAGSGTTITVNGVVRTYLVRVPAPVARRSTPVPLVVVLHGGGGDAANAERMTGFTQKAAREGFIVVYPEGSGRLGDKLLTWNAGHCCAFAMRESVDDVAFIAALLDELQRKHPIDPRRIYVTGMSNGGMMTHRLGIELSGRIAAIAPVVAAVFGDEKSPPNAVPALMINGALDENVPPDGGRPGGRGSNAWDGTPTRPALDQAAFWASTNGCSSTPQEQEVHTRIHWRYSCAAGREVELLMVKDNGHAWPGGKPGSRRGDEPSTTVNATDLIWEFFERHHR